MILAAGLSPAWQQIVLLQALRLGEVNRAQEVHWCASGKVGNVAIALRHLGQNVPPVRRSSDTTMLTLRGGITGEALQRELVEWGIDCRWVVTAAPTRVCTTLLDLQQSITTEIVENAGAISTDELAEFRSLFGDAAGAANVIVLTGSFPAGVPVDFYRQLVTSAPETARILIDAQGESLRSSCEAKPFLVKPNREELGRTLGRTLHSDADVWEAMESLQQLGAQNVLVTQGAGPVRLSFGNRRFQFAPFPISVVNPIASGDCLAAGIAWGLDNGKDLTESVRIGISAAADNAEQLLPARLNRQSVLARALQIAMQEIV